MAIENLSGLSALSLPHLLRGLLPAIEVIGWLGKPWSPDWGEFHVGSLSFRREAGRRMYVEGSPPHPVPTWLEQTYPKNQGCSALCVLVPTAHSVLHSPLMNSFNKQSPACFPGYKRRKQCGALVEPRQAREKSQGLLTLAESTCWAALPTSSSPGLSSRE